MIIKSKIYQTYCRLKHSSLFSITKRNIGYVNFSQEIKLHDRSRTFLSYGLRKLLDFRVLEDGQRCSNAVSWDAKGWKCCQTSQRLKKKLNIKTRDSISWSMRHVNFKILTFSWVDTNKIAFFSDQVTFNSTQGYQVHGAFLSTLVIDSEADVSSLRHKLPSEWWQMSCCIS